MVFRTTSRRGKRVKRTKNARRGRIKKNAKRTRNTRGGKNVRRMRKTLRKRNRRLQKGGSDELIGQLIMASGRGDLEKVITILNAFPYYVNKEDMRGIATPLSVASSKGHVDVVNVLIERGAKVNQVLTGKGTTPLFSAIILSKLDIVKVLINNGADVEKADPYGRTPLYWASIMIPNVGIVTALLEAGADVNKVDIEKVSSTEIRKLLQEALEIRDNSKQRGPMLHVLRGLWDSRPEPEKY